ncbi:MAG: hypothetical protein ACYCT9_13350 [Leptospirillum sp.]|jgi:hypothetical protein
MQGIGIVNIHDDIWVVWLIETPDHQQTGDMIKRLSTPLPKTIANDFAVQRSKDRNIPLLNP